MPHPKLNRAGVSLDDFVADVLKSPGFGECLQLCDVAELEHVCDLIPEAFAVARYGDGDSYGLHLSLRRNLRAPVSRYVEELEKWQLASHKRRLDALKEKHGAPVQTGMSVRMEMQPSLDFLEHIDCVAEQIEYGPWSEGDAEACANRLRFAWYKWIAYLSSFWMWGQVPRTLAMKRLAKRNGGQPAKDGKPGRKPKHDRSAICEAYDRELPSKGSGAAGVVAARFGCTPKTVRAQSRVIISLVEAGHFSEPGM